MTAERREQLCGFLDAAVEAAKDAGVLLSCVTIDVVHDEWPAVCELLEIDGRTTSVVGGLWQKTFPVEAHKLPAPKKARRRASTSPAAHGAIR